MICISTSKYMPIIGRKQAVIFLINQQSYKPSEAGIISLF